MPLLQKALKKSQAFEESFSSPEILLFCFECRRQRNNTAQSLECPLNFQGHCSQQLFSPRVLMEVQWPQQTQITLVLFSETATHKISLRVTSPQLKNDSVAVFKTHISFAPHSVCKQPWIYRCIEWSVLLAAENIETFQRSFVYFVSQFS